MEGEQAVELILRELRRAEEKHPGWPDDHVHAVGILIEEAGEAMKEALDIHYQGKGTEDLITELAQTGAMALRSLMNVEGKVETDTAYFKDLSPRQQLNDLMHKYSQTHGLPYGESWREFGRRFKDRHRVNVSWMRHSYCEDHQIKMTMPAFLETTQRLDQALEIAHEMTGNMMKGSLDA